ISRRSGKAAVTLRNGTDGSRLSTENAVFTRNHPQQTRLMGLLLIKDREWTIPSEAHRHGQPAGSTVRE
ncbi:hypothetical protein AB0K09_23690, partial [Streptomyces sp. NPDC049577]|uniref:hypothetical protein n=1 Tax=Streptomyces sp. NPDC049577 TaxID=3155153 RepID=UPI0034305C92